MIKLKLKDLTTGKEFNKEFDPEFERDKFKSNLKYRTKLIVVEDIEEELCK